mgnify:FL=1|tara:strand:+ start:73 stop:363 length:291 start_codon:yes stop_codon:yes gene_type:complete
MWDSVDNDKVKKIIKQITGKVDDDHGELIPMIVIKGTKGYIWCYHPNEKRFIGVKRGTLGYIISDKIYKEDKLLIYTATSQIIIIEKDELVELGFN